MDEYYKILNLRDDASIKEIKAAKNELLQIWHPDYFQRNPELARIAEERTKLINDAYDKLIEYLKTGYQPPTRSKQPHSGSQSESNSQTAYARQRAEQERQQREQAERERINKERTAERERTARGQAEQEIIRQQHRKRIIKTWFFAVAGLVTLLLLSTFLIRRRNAQTVEEDHVSNLSGMTAPPSTQSTPARTLAQAQPTSTAQAAPERVYCEGSQPIMLTIPNKFESIKLRRDCWTRGVDDPKRYGNGFFESTSDSKAIYIVRCSNGREFSARGYMQAWQYMGCEPPLYFKAMDKPLILKVRIWKIF